MVADRGRHHEDQLLQFMTYAWSASAGRNNEGYFARVVQQNPQCGVEALVETLEDFGFRGGLGVCEFDSFAWVVTLRSPMAGNPPVADEGECGVDEGLGTG